jgi:murein DD-endopeptidase MepM/ murein hydrolase activator NlpD
MKNQYQQLMEEIHVPEGLNDRVLWAARTREAQEKTAASKPKRLAKRNFHPMLRTAVCAACALALVLGTVHFYPTSQTGDGTSDTATVALPTLSFGLTAYAADTGEAYAPGVNGGLALTAGYGGAGEEIGDYTGCWFQVTGEHLKTVSMSIDRGGLYRNETRNGLDTAQVQALFQQEARGEIVCAVHGLDENSPMTAEVMTALGGSFTEDYDETVQYGFWVPPELYQLEDENGDLRQSAWDSIDTFDGARLTVTVTFTDGSAQSKTYTLSTGRLRMEYDEDGTIHVLPQLAGDEEPCVYGVYAVDESESRWFQWPVADCTVIQLSNPYGEVNGVFHPGIDIAASAGSIITAAADGTVLEAGFTAEDGNYLILDHGDGLETKYAHCQEVTVSEGDQVSAGEAIATVGSTGQSTGPHLCFQVWQDGEAQNPVAYFDSDIRDTLSMQ